MRFVLKYTRDLEKNMPEDWPQISSRRLRNATAIKKQSPVQSVQSEQRNGGTAGCCTLVVAVDLVIEFKDSERVGPSAWKR